MMGCTNYLILFCYALVSSNALSMPQATPLPQKGNLANATVQSLGNSSANTDSFNLRLDRQGGTITMDVGPLSIFTRIRTSVEVPTGTGCVLYPTNYDELQEIPENGMDIICDEETQQLMLDEFNTACVPDKIKDPACIEGLGATLYKRSPNLQKRFLPILPAIAVVIAIDALLIAVYAELIQESGPEYKAVTQVHYESSVLASVSALSSATKASVVLVETTVGDKQAITVSTSELISFNPSSTTSSPSNPSGLLTTDSSGHFTYQFLSSDIPMLESAEKVLASPTPSCTIGTSPLIERDNNYDDEETTSLIERDDTDVDEEATCLANRLMDNADGLMNPNGLVSTFRTRIEEVAAQMVPDFVPIFQDVRVAGAFGLFLIAADTLIPLLFPALAQTAWLIAGFIAFGITMLPLASNTQGKLQTSSGLTQIVLKVTKGESGSGTQALCPPEDQPYNCASFFCAGNAKNVCTGVWSEGCPCTECPSIEDMPSCDDCNSNTTTVNGKCTTEYRGCSCYIDTMQNSNFEDLSFNQLATQLSGSVATWVSTNSFPYMAGVMCRPDNFWYGSCQYPNTETCAYGPNVEFENVIDDFFTFGTAQDAYNTPVPNPTLPSSMMMSSQSLRNVTMIYPTNKITVDFIINVAWAPGCISPNGQVNISDPIGDGSISGRDVIRGTYYGCLNFIASYDSSANTIDMVPGSAGKGYKTSSLPAPGNLYPGASNSGLGGWNQIGCLIYEVIPSKNRPLITENQGSTNVWIQSENWAQYQTVWPTLAGTYYNHSAWYCKPPPPAINYKSPPPCPAFPCPLGDYGRNLSQINNLIQTDQRCT